jgi:hypothetical protein
MGDGSAVAHLALCPYHERTLGAHHDVPTHCARYVHGWGSLFLVLN